MNKDTFIVLVFDSKSKPYRKVTGYYREPVAVRSFTLDFHDENFSDSCHLDFDFTKKRKVSLIICQEFIGFGFWLLYRDFGILKLVRLCFNIFLFDQEHL